MHRSVFFRLTLFFAFFLASVAAGFYFLALELEHRDDLVKEEKIDRIFSLLRQSVLMPEAERKRFFSARGYGYRPYDPVRASEWEPVFALVPERFGRDIAESVREGRIGILRSDGALNVVIRRPDAPFVISESYRPDYRRWLWGAFAALAFLIVVLFVSIFHSLLPLRRLAGAIRKYGENGTYVPTKMEGKDEIAYVANAFDEAVRKNRALIEARHLFLRNVMHELKTPITVGKLSLPFFEATQEREILERAFRRMEVLIEDMAHVEAVTTQTAVARKETCRLEELVDEAEALMLEMPGTVERRFDAECTLHADRRMMVTVFKNLIDNAWKYSEDRTVQIRCDGKELVFANRGEPWPEDQRFETLLEPFRLTGSPERPSESFGLGLYIVKSILDTHGMTFSHRYEAGRHLFVIAVTAD